MKIKTGNTTFNIKINGSDEKPWLILSNSLGADYSMWDNQVNLLSKAYKILRYDTRGHGKTEVTKGPYSFDILCEDVINIMNALEISKASFMGLSMGGMTGIGLGIKYPERFVRVICAAARADVTEELKIIWEERINTIKAKGLSSIINSTLKNWISESTQKNYPNVINYIKKMVTSHNPDGYISNCEALKNLNYLTKLDQIRIPFLYIGGSKDFVAPPNIMKEMSLKTKGSEYIEVQDAYHLLNLDKPKNFEKGISKFLAL